MAKPETWIVKGEFNSFAACLFRGCLSETDEILGEFDQEEPA